jgi:hypothetical protein
MSVYKYGESKNKPQSLQKTVDMIRQDLEHLRRIEAQLVAETAGKEAELARIRAARKKLEPKATYKPTAEALAYREANHEAIAAQPKPLHGGPAGLRRASAEYQAHYATKAAA